MHKATVSPARKMEWTKFDPSIAQTIQLLETACPFNPDSAAELAAAKFQRKTNTPNLLREW
jgi:hypothetical protein